MQKYRVIQYGTGTLGKIAIRALADHPELELAGLLVHHEEKVGQDAGTLAGIAPLGIVATDDTGRILALEADAVSFMGIWPDLDLICAMLESGKHVALSSGLVFPSYLGEAVVQRLEAACAKGNTCVFGGGISPGYVQTVAPLSLTALARRVDKIVIDEFADFHDVDQSPELIHDMLGLGRSLEDVQQRKHPYFDEMMPDFFNQTVALIAAAVKLPLDRIQADIEYAVSPGGGTIAACTIPPGTVGGVRSTFIGIANGQEKIIVRLNWSATYDLGSGWFSREELSNSTQWRITVEGDPSMRLTFEQADSFLNPEARGGKSTSHSYIITAMTLINAIPYLCEQRSPGIRHYADLPLMAGRHTMR